MVNVDINATTFTFYAGTYTHYSLYIRTIYSRPTVAAGQRLRLSYAGDPSSLSLSLSLSDPRSSTPVRAGTALNKEYSFTMGVDGETVLSKL